jgi:hypothetical protein
MTRRPRTVALLVAVSTALLAPAAAAAATRYASPLGGGAQCTSAKPCPLPHAVGAAKTGDEVVVRPGTYTIGATLDDPAKITIHGVARRPRPRFQVAFDGQAVRLDDASTIRYVEIDDDGGLALFTSGAHIDQLIIHSAGSQVDLAEIQSGSVITNSIVVSSGDGTKNLTTITNGGDNTSAYRNVTSVATGSGAVAVYAEAFGSPQQPGHARIDATNVIAQAPLGQAMRAVTGGGGQTSATIVAAASNYPTRSTSGPHASVTAPGSGSNQTATPVFVDALAGDYHQAAGSPTIDAGATARANGTLDVDGDLRAAGARTDIGADERIPAPTAVTGKAKARKLHAATLTGTIRSAAAVTSYHFEYGTSTAYGRSTPARTVGPAGTAQKVSAPLTGLHAGTPYHFRLVASSAAGPASGADAKFATVFQGVAILANKVPAPAERAPVRLRCPAATTGPCEGTLTLRRATGTTKKVGSTAFSIPAGKARVVRVELSQAARQQLDDDGSLRVRAVAKAHNGLGVTRTRKRKLTLVNAAG